MSLYISPSEIPAEDLKDIINRSYSTFRHPERTPVVELDGKQNLYLLELFHGPTFAFKDVALQFLGNLFEYFLTRNNKGKTGRGRIDGYAMPKARAKGLTFRQIDITSPS